jgi:hypothetical protein
MVRPASGKNQSQIIIDLIESIALEETSLASLIHAEEQIVSLVKSSELSTDEPVGKILSFQSAVNSVLNTTYSMQMLLLKKMETILDYYVKDCLALKEFHKTKEVERSVTATEKNIVRHTVFNLTGNAGGLVTSKNDYFHQGQANIEANVSCYNGAYRENILAYRVKKEKFTQRMTVLPQQLSFEYEALVEQTKTAGSGRWIISGKGATDRLAQGREPLTDDCRFTFSFWHEASQSFMEKLFRMVIIAENKPELSHDSGVVTYSGSLQAIVPDIEK